MIVILTIMAMILYLHSTAYDQLVKRFYLTRIRADINYSVQLFGQFMHESKQSHRRAAKKVLTYMKGNPDMWLLMLWRSNEELIAYRDSDWASVLCQKEIINRLLCKVLSKKQLDDFISKLGLLNLDAKLEKEFLRIQNILCLMFESCSLIWSF